MPWAKALLVGPDAPLAFLMDALKMLAAPMIPCMMLVLGAVLHKGLAPRACLRASSPAWSPCAWCSCRSAVRARLAARPGTAVWDLADLTPSACLVPVCLRGRGVWCGDRSAVRLTAVSLGIGGQQAGWRAYM